MVGRDLPSLRPSAFLRGFRTARRTKDCSSSRQHARPDLLEIHRRLAVRNRQIGQRLADPVEGPAGEVTDLTAGCTDPSASRSHRWCRPASPCSAAPAGPLPDCRSTPCFCRSSLARNTASSRLRTCFGLPREVAFLQRQGDLVLQVGCLLQRLAAQLFSLLLPQQILDLLPLLRRVFGRDLADLLRCRSSSQGQILRDRLAAVEIGPCSIAAAAPTRPSQVAQLVAEGVGLFLGRGVGAEGAERPRQVGGSWRIGAGGDGCGPAAVVYWPNSGADRQCGGALLGQRLVIGINLFPISIDR